MKNSKFKVQNLRLLTVDNGLLTLNNGFTLLELMISIVILTLIVLIIGGAMRLGYRSVQFLCICGR